MSNSEYGRSEEAKSVEAGKEEDAVRPLVVDLDGTLAATDLLWESLFAASARAPHLLLRVPFWLARGRAQLKSRLAERADLDVTHLPYREEVLELIRSRKNDGARIVLATATDGSLARRVGDHLGIFDDVLASDGVTNCKGARKLGAIRELLGDLPFDYVGDSNADLPLISEAAAVWLVNPTPSLRRSAEFGGKLRQVLGEPPNRLGAMVRLIRPHQWAKNLLLFVPLIAAHQLADSTALLSTGLAFLAFSLAASAIYIVNDLFDLRSDRLHDRKRHRPLAAGEIPIPTAILMTVLLLASAGTLAGTLLPVEFLAVLGGYVLLTMAYSLWLKRKVFVDVLLLGGLYAYRIYAGGVVTGIVISEWLTAFSIFFFLCLALAKRYCELDRLADRGEVNEQRAYRVEDLALLRSLGPSAGFVAVLVMALFISSPATETYARRELLWLVCPVLLYWITRIWFLANRRELSDDPVVFALKDWRSLLAGALTAGIVAAGS